MHASRGVFVKEALIESEELISSARSSIETSSARRGVA
jgi:hypothetical protein